MAKMTSAYANKLLKQLDEDKEFFLEKERNSSTYTAAVGEEPVIPEYDYSEVANEIASINEKIQIIKHAINLANVNSLIDVKGKQYSVDTILVKMAQLNKRKAMLDSMRKIPAKRRLETRSYMARTSNVPEYTYINFDPALIKKEYEDISDEIMAMQIALDKYNQTYEFEISL